MGRPRLARSEKDTAPKHSDTIQRNDARPPRWSALAEKIGYATSAALVTAQATVYTASVTRRARPAAGFGALLAGLFGGLYVLLGLKSYALVVGAAALFIVLSIVMAVTQYLRNKTEEPKTEP